MPSSFDAFVSLVCIESDARPLDGVEGVRVESSIGFNNVHKGNIVRHVAERHTRSLAWNGEGKDGHHDAWKSAHLNDTDQDVALKGPQETKLAKFRGGDEHEQRRCGKGRDATLVVVCWWQSPRLAPWATEAKGHGGMVTACDTVLERVLVGLSVNGAD